MSLREARMPSLRDKLEAKEEELQTPDEIEVPEEEEVDGVKKVEKKGRVIKNKKSK